MIRKSALLQKMLVLPVTAAFVAFGLGFVGCGPNEGAKAIPLEKNKEETQKESEQLPGIPVKGKAVNKRR